ncbi:MAG: tripartite tricarboxylate transporter substrate binding protein [Burkholderiales bacterium]|nr:tripartite tricarboxylate transporter substrate binding protein [Burkholderiales bacterium]
MQRLFRALVGIAACALSAAAAAQSWPTQPLRFIVPFPPGGTVDQFARLLQPHLQSALGQSIVIENRAGASGSIGAAAAAKAAPDGTTWLWVFDTHGVNPSLIPNLPFDTQKDLAPVMLIGKGAMVLTAHASQPFKAWSEVLAAARAKPASLSYGSIGSGSLAHLAMTAIENQIKADFTHVPYKGGGPLAADAIAGHVPLAMATYALFQPHIAAGKLRPITVTSPRRMTQLPDVPTFAESGLPGFEAEAWWGVFAPTGTPAPLIMRMHAEIAKALRVPSVQERMNNIGVVVTAAPPEELGRFLAGEIARWGKVVRDNKIKAGE